ncbi:hypothetical protein ON010_g3909 [Phytophthora cinnamomi]|nr:hypothetical protein ON010_g3909 [Phytophthora cinnamomi]
MPTPSSASSSRRASISSVTSSGRRRKDQSLLDVAASLGQRTPERSQPSGEGVPARSRQLDFGSEAGDDVDDEQTQLEGDDAQAGDVLAQGGAKEEGAGDGEAAAGGEMKVPVQVEIVDREDEEGDSLESERDAADIRPRRGRRATVFWSEDEEEFLRQGVARRGIGKWKQILHDGAGVFSAHRTNVDLKDKWKNLQTSRQTSRRRRKAPGTLTPPAENDEPDSERDAPERPAKRRAPSNANASEESSADSAQPRPRRKAAVVAGRAMTRVAKQNAEAESLPGEVNEEYRVEDRNSDPDSATTDSNELTGSVELKIATDKSFPEVVGLESRTLFEDNERLSQCIRKNGPEFFIVSDENPEEFV